VDNPVYNVGISMLIVHTSG